MADEGIQKPGKTPRSRPRDDDDDQDSPRHSVKKAASGSSSTALILILVLGGGALLLCCVGVPIVFVFFTGLRVAQEDKPIAVGPMPADGAIIVGKDARPPINVKPLEPPLKLAGTRFLIDANHNEVKDIVFADKGQSVAYLMWDTRGAFKHFVDTWDWKTQKKLARVEVPVNGNGLELSPKGSRLMTIQGGAPLTLNTWSLPGGQQLQKSWNPYPRDPQKFDINAPELTWASYLDEDKIVSISRTGQFDVWDTNKNQIIATRAKPKKTVFLTQNFSARTPQNFAVSPDRRFVALANGEGFDFCEAVAAKDVGKTPAFGAEGAVGNVWAAAFNRDGTLFASKYNLFQAGKSQEFISVWEVPTGVRKWHHPVAQDFNRNGPLAWLGPNHLMVWDGNVFKAAVFRLSDGKYLRQFDMMNPGDRFARTGPDGRIWYSTSANALARAELLAVDFPENEVAGPVPNANPLPAWYFGLNGIMRNRQ